MYFFPALYLDSKSRDKKENLNLREFTLDTGYLSNLNSILVLVLRHFDDR
jgi:hypothetical protein